MIDGNFQQGSRLKEYVIISILLVILIVGFLWQLFFLGEAFLPADMVNPSVHPWVLSEQNQYEIGARPHNSSLSDPIYIYYPMKHYLAESFSQGDQPMWNPSSFGGYPYNSRLVSELYSPLNFLFLFIPTVYAFGFSVAFYLFLAGMFTYVLCKSLGMTKTASFFAAVVFMFNANTITWLQFPTHLKGELWMPIIFLFLIRFYREKKIIFAMLGGIFIGLQIISGYAQAVQFTAIAIAILLAVYIVYDIRDKNYRHILNNIGGTALAGVIALGIGLSFILPFYRELSGSLRAVQGGRGIGSFNFRYLATMLNPNFFGNGVTGNFWLPRTNFIESVRYSGIATLFLAGIAVAFKRGKIVFSFFAVAAAAVLLNSVPQVFALFNMIIPFFDRGTIARILLLLPFCLAVLSGYGLSYLDRLDIRHNIKKNRILIFTIGLAVLFGLVMAALNLHYNNNVDFTRIGEHPNIRLETLSLVMFGAMTVASVFFIAMALKTSFKKIFLVLLAPLLILDLFVFGINFNPTSDPDQIFFKTQGIEYMQQDKEKGRVLGIMGGTFSPNSMWVFGLEDVGGYDPFLPHDYARFWAAFQGGARVRPNGKVGADRLYSNFLKLTNTRYIASYAFVQEMGYFYKNLDKNLNEGSRERSTSTNWNFMEYIVPVIEVEPDSVLEYDYFIPSSSELVFYNALHPDCWDLESGDGVTYRIYIENDHKREMIFEQDIDPINIEEDKRWYMHRVDLSEYEDVEARIIFETDAKGSQAGQLPGWGNPRVMPIGSLMGFGELMLDYNQEIKIYSNQMYLPRAYLAGESKHFEDNEKVLEHIANNHWLDLEDTVLLKEDAGRLQGTSDGEANIVHYSNNRVKIEAETSGPAYLVLLDRFDKDWNAYVNGEKTEILQANYLFRAVYLEPGTHSIDFRYQPVWFFIALGISSLVFIASVLSCIMIYKFRKKRDYAAYKE